MKGYCPESAPQYFEGVTNLLRISIQAIGTISAILSAATAAGAGGSELLQPAAQQDYPYAGYYAATRGDDCIEDKALANEDSILIVAPRVDNGQTYYFAIPLQVNLKTADGKPRQVEADGSLQGLVTDSADVMGIKMKYQIRVLLRPRDDERIVATEWTVTYLDKDGNVKDVVDMTKEDGGNYGGKAHDNLLGLQPGAHGICLKRVGAIPG